MLKRTLHRGVLWSIFLTAAGVSAYDWSFRVSDNTKQVRFDVHAAILNHSATAPERFRVLVPFVMEVPIQAMARFTPYEKGFGRVFAVFYLVAIAGLLYSQYAYLTLYFHEEHALVGALIAATTLPITLRNTYYAPFSLLEPTFFALALIWIHQSQHVRLAALLVVATLNRETAIFIVLLYVVASPLDRSHLQRALGYFLIWATLFVGLRYAYGPAERYWDLATIWQGNTIDRDQVVIAMTNVALLFGALWVFAVLGVRRAPAFVRRTALVLPVYLITVLVWGIWVEVRLLQPLYPIVLPLALSYIFEPRSQGRPA